MLIASTSSNRLLVAGVALVQGISLAGVWVHAQATNATGAPVTVFLVLCITYAATIAVYSGVLGVRSLSPPMTWLLASTLVACWETLFFGLVVPFLNGNNTLAEWSEQHPLFAFCFVVSAPAVVAAATWIACSTVRRHWLVVLVGSLVLSLAAVCATSPTVVWGALESAWMISRITGKHLSGVHVPPLGYHIAMAVATPLAGLVSSFASGVGVQVSRDKDR